MTACVNRKHTKKVAAVVTASLVGALSLGVAPVAAMAEEAGIDLQAMDWSADAAISGATDGKGQKCDADKATFTVGEGKYLVPTTLDIDGVPTPVDDEYTVTYTAKAGEYVTDHYEGLVAGGYLIDGDDEKPATVTANADGTVSFGSELAASYFAGTLTNPYGYKVEPVEGAVTVTVAKANGDKGEVTATFKLVEKTDESVYSLKSPVYYNGIDQKNDIKFVDEDGDDYLGPVSWKNADGTPHGGDAEVKDAGTYYATLDNGQTIAVEVQQLDLSEAVVTIADQKAGGLNNAKILDEIKVNGQDLSDIIKVVSRSNPDGYKSGVNTVTIGAKDADNEANITGTATVEFTVYDNNVASTVKYGRSPYTTTSPLEIYLEDGDVFDASKIKVEGKLDGEAVSYTGEQLEIKYGKLDENDNETAVEASALAEKGEYIVHVRVVPFQDFATDDWNGGSIDFKVVVEASKLDADKTAGFYIDGELAGDKETVLYDGTDWLSKLEVVVKNAEGEAMAEGTDYDLKVTNEAGKEVEEAVDADDYEIEIVPKTFQFDNGDYTFELTVSPVALDSLKDVDGVAYTGSAIEVPAVSYAVKDADGKAVLDKDGKQVFAELPSDMYNVVMIKDEDGKTVSEIKDEGTYTVTIALSDAAKANYTLTDAKFGVTVEEFGQFSDVQADAWYAKPVEQAWRNWYINGISGTNFYAPEADITRADAVCVLFNMAGGFSMGDDDFSYSEEKGYDTGFADVDGHAYFAKALAWAHAAGIANGSEGNFRPYDQITREEFASLLANFAKNKGEFEAAADGALDGVSDAGTVSDWAKDNVAWAVENGVMGNGGFVAGQSNITRAEVASMAVNYQPKALVDLPVNEDGSPIR